MLPISLSLACFRLLCRFLQIFAPKIHSMHIKIEPKIAAAQIVAAWISLTPPMLRCLPLLLLLLLLNNKKKYFFSTRLILFALDIVCECIAFPVRMEFSSIKIPVYLWQTNASPPAIPANTYTHRSYRSHFVSAASVHIHNVNHSQRFHFRFKFQTSVKHSAHIQKFIRFHSVYFAL